ncbi:MAG: DNA polymerase III subunit delta' [Endozoicomonas sp. (ex Botrylloides leachii)]|nr:DNA polymerase III subunit delta' [Endozoicomonas sp. (ex Botrylloides leachii)]
MKTLSPLPWQQDVWNHVVTQSRTNRLAHAFLLKGMQGLGKMHFAKVLAHWLLCESSGDLPCNICKGCLLVQAGSHPDLLVIEPEETTRVIKIDQVRKLNTFAQKTAQQGGHRIIVISPAETMNINASNALLKSLEEPGAKTLFLLVSHRTGDLLPTVRSRCQTLTFPVPSHVIAVPWLQEKINDPAPVELLLRLAAGSPFQALLMAENNVLEQRDELIQSISALFRGERTVVELARKWKGKDCVQMLTWLSSWLEDIIRFSMAHDPQHIHNYDAVKLVQYFAYKTEPRQVLELRGWLLNCQHLITNGVSLNPQLVVEGVFCRLLSWVM